MTFQLSQPHNNFWRKLTILLVVFAAATAIGAATAAWFSYGPQIFLTLADSALAWCF